MVPRGWQKYASPMERMKVCSELDPATGCWNWLKSRTKLGYGKLARGPSGWVHAHRGAYEAFIGAIPEGLDVCHKCDNPSCVNPAHLYVGTRSENMQDASRRGRHWTQARPAEEVRQKLANSHVRKAKGCALQRGAEHWSHRKPGLVRTGARHHNAKTNADVVRAMREEYARGGVLQRDLAAKYGLAKQTVQRIVRGKLWREIV